MKDRLMKNLGLKILSLLIALVVWLLIINVEDPDITKKFEDIPVTVINADAITEKGKVYTITSGNTVDITVTGRSSFVKELNRSDLVAVADLSQLSITWAVNIEVSCSRYTPTNPTFTLGATKVMKIEIENKESEKFPVEIQLSGEIDSNYYISEKSASPNMITVTGAESVINKIHKVALDLNVQGRTTGFKKVINKEDFLVYDNNGDLIDNSKLTFSEDEIGVGITLQKTKEVKFIIVPVGEPKNGYVLKSEDFEYTPKKIKVAGEEDALKAISEIRYEYDISGRFEDYEQNLSVSDDLAELFRAHNVIPVDETLSIAISVKFEKLVTQEVVLSPSEIELKNLSSQYHATINTSHSSVLVQGEKKIVENLTAADLWPYIDLSGITGTRLLNVQFPGSPDYKILNQPTVNVSVQPNAEGTNGSE